MQCVPYSQIQQIFYCLYDFIRLISFTCSVQTITCTMWFSAMNWLCLGFMYWYDYLESFGLILHMKQTLPKPSHSAEFPVVCMIWYGWIQSYAMIKQQDVRWCGFRWSIPISIDNIWSWYIDRAISTPCYTYCLLNSYITHRYWQLEWRRKRSLMLNFNVMLV